MNGIRESSDHLLKMARACHELNDCDGCTFEAECQSFDDKHLDAKDRQWKPAKQRAGSTMGPPAP